MYNLGDSNLGGLGEEFTSASPGWGISAQGTPAPAPEGGLLTAINFANNIVNTGFNIFNRVQQLQMAKKQTVYAQQAAQGTLQYRMAQAQAQAQAAVGGMSSWIIPIVLGAGAIGVILFIRSK